MKKLLFSITLVILVLVTAAQPKPVRLWQGVKSMQSAPTKLYCYPAPDSINTGTAVIVCPGGSYSHTMGIATEGFGVAEWLNSQGINAFVLKYRVGSQGYHHPAMLEDVQMAIHYVRTHGDDYHINSGKVGTMGFSAGGHLSLMAGAFSQENLIADKGISGKINLKPNFVVAIYPVVSMQDDIAHQRSRRNLLTRHYTPEEQSKYSMELSIPGDMPPVFLATAEDDPVVMYQNSVRLDQSLRKAQVKHKFLLYKTGGHGYGADESKAPEASKWKYEFDKWINELFDY